MKNYDEKNVMKRKEGPKKKITERRKRRHVTLVAGVNARRCYYHRFGTTFIFFFLKKKKKTSVTVETTTPYNYCYYHRYLYYHYHYNNC